MQGICPAFVGVEALIVLQLVDRTGLSICQVGNHFLAGIACYSERGGHFIYPVDFVGQPCYPKPQPQEYQKQD
jgi:hypothetical protein